MPAPRRRALAVCAALAAVLGNTVPALAATAPALLHAPIVATSPHLVGPHGTPITQGTSTNWAGYAATGAKFTSVSASWVEPTGLCTNDDTWSSFWVGLDGDGSDSVEQTGSEVDCSGGSPQYYSWYEMYPAYPVMFTNEVRPGDHFAASVTETGAGSFTLKLADTTQGWSHSIKRTLPGAALASAEIIAEAPRTPTAAAADRLPAGRLHRGHRQRQADRRLLPGERHHGRPRRDGAGQHLAADRRQRLLGELAPQLTARLGPPVVTGGPRHVDSGVPVLRPGPAG